LTPFDHPSSQMKIQHPNNHQA